MRTTPHSAGPKRRLTENLFRVGSLALGSLIGAVIVAIVVGIVARGRISPVVLLLVVAVLFLLTIPGLVLGLVLSRRIFGSRIEGAMRLSGDKWTHGNLSAGPSHISFQPYLWQVRIPSGEPVEFDVTTLGDDTGRRPPARQIWSINPQVHIVDVVTPDGVTLLAALPSRIAALRAHLGEDTRSDSATE